MDFPFEFNHSSTAFIVQLNGPSAELTLDEKHNRVFDNRAPSSPKSLMSGTDQDTREQTPAILADEVSTEYILFPWTPMHEKVGYVCGRNGEYSHLKLPARLARALSAAHFKIFRSPYKTWMIESLSSNGTMYLGLVPQSQQKALHPDEPNEICIGDLRLLVHIPRRHIMCPLEYGSYPSGYSEASIRPTPPASVRTSSSVVSSLEASVGRSSQTLRTEDDGYHICKKRPILPDRPKKFQAVRIRDGRPCVVKQYSGTKEQYARILEPSRNCQSIVSYIEYIEHGELGRTIVTEFVNAQTLEEKMKDGIDPAWAALMYGQLIDALCFLQESNFIHRDVQLSTILVSPSRVWLTGFSCCIDSTTTKRWFGNPGYGAPEVQLSDQYDTRVDVYSLSKVCFKCLSSGSSDSNSMPEIQRGDPEVVSLVSAGVNVDPSQRQFASDIKSHLHSLMGNRLEIPFRSFWVTKKRCVVRLKHEGEYWIRAKELLDALYTQGLNDSDDLRCFLRRYKTIEGQICLPVRAALKLCHRFNLETFGAHIRSQSTRHEFLERKTMYYHAPSLMYNIDQLLRIAGREAASSCIGKLNPKCQQEVRGVKKWEGTYIDSQTFKDITDFLRQDHGVIIHQRVKASNNILSERFSSKSRGDDIVLVTPQFNPHMLYLRRTDCSVNWDPFSSLSDYISVEESLSKCDELDLPDLRETICNLQTFDWLKERLLWDPEYDSDATSILSNDSFRSKDSEDDMKFNPIE